jgi:transposase-like protein
LKPLCEELEAALGAEKSARVGEARQGDRHGTRERTLTTSLGPMTIEMPRARLEADGTPREWHSQTVRRYERRTTRMDEAILGVYLAGKYATNQRRVSTAAAWRSALEGYGLAPRGAGYARTSRRGGPAISRT